jgi:hypothetical protein
MLSEITTVDLIAHNGFGSGRLCCLFGLSNKSMVLTREAVV